MRRRPARPTPAIERTVSVAVSMEGLESEMAAVRAAYADTPRVPVRVLVEVGPSVLAALDWSEFCELRSLLEATDSEVVPMGHGGWDVAFNDWAAAAEAVCPDEALRWPS